MALSLLLLLLLLAPLLESCAHTQRLVRPTKVAIGCEGLARHPMRVAPWLRACMWAACIARALLAWISLSELRPTTF